MQSLFRFGGAGALSFSINVGLTAFLHEVLGVLEEIAFAISLVVAFIVNFITCRYYVFDGRSGDVRKQLLAHLVLSLFFRGTEYLGFLLLHTVMGLPYLLAVVTVLVVSFAAKFLFYKNVVFS